MFTNEMDDPVKAVGSGRYRALPTKQLEFSIELLQRRPMRNNGCSTADAMMMKNLVARDVASFSEVRVGVDCSAVPEEGADDRASASVARYRVTFGFQTL